jgi:Domain of unknown function (DUF4372)
MSQCNTILSQLLKMVGGHEFEKIANTHRQGQKSRKTSRWPQFIALAFAQSTGRQSQRDIEADLNARRQHGRHWAARRSPVPAWRGPTTGGPPVATKRCFVGCTIAAPRKRPSMVSGSRTRCMPWTLRSSACRSNRSLGRITPCTHRA